MAPSDPPTRAPENPALALRVARRLGLSLLGRPFGPPRERCHGYQNGCRCRRCREGPRGPQSKKAAPKQPWELKS